MQKLSDEELMVKIANGDAHAFEVLFLRHRAKVFGYLLSRARDHSLAEDLLQEAFEKVYKKAHTFDSQSPFLPWIFMIMKNSLTDRMRKLMRDQSLEEKLLEETAKEVNSQPELREVNLEQLPERYQTALKLRYFEDRDLDEIAKEMSLSVSNVRQIISRAIRRLRKSGV